ncbi:hypothetical protein [Actinomadura rupiterrae]|uniref:hypothetical protein n=1 Tax=Actinomadura rupiterrae TaxID=559627 RepID=UPI0020A2AD24|nr:hypothetical protein [Actinomadura rupiterrae]MCP2339326.1 hypothetical protein [Actinomadura rupiterrae]
MERRSGTGRAALTAIRAALGTAGLFEALSLLASQDKAVRATSPWQDDPYDVFVSFAIFAVPMLAGVITLRMLAWRAPGGPDRAHQMLRATWTMTALIWVTLLAEAAAVAVGAHAAIWNRWTAVLISGLAVATAAALVVTVLLARQRRPRGSAAQWRHDWLGDVVWICGRVPALRRWTTDDNAAWVRRHAMGVFLGLSALVALGLVGALAGGEGWTDPLLIAWALAVETAAYLAFCWLSNLIGGFIARPPRTSARRTAELSVVVGCVAIQLAVAFRNALGSALGTGDPADVPSLVLLTLGAGLLSGTATAVPLIARRREPAG